MVSGTQWPTGDPFLQRQNEPSMAVSTRNPMHILAGSNDYRTVDLELALSGGAETGDSWLGLFNSTDGGLTWNSTLLPGCPESVPQCADNGALGGRYQAASDPVVRAGTNGMFYYAGLAFDRASGPASASSVSSIFVARYDDLNNNENLDTITYLDTHVIVSGNNSQFLDKPALAVDIPRSGAVTCSFTAQEPGAGPNGGNLSVPQSFPAGNVYITYTDFLAATKANATPTHLMFTRSTDCGVTWSTPLQLNTGTTTSQGSAIAVNGLNGNVYVAWRQFASNGLPDAIMAAVSTNAGRTFSAPVRISTFQPFDQGTTYTAFRTNAYPSITTDFFGFVYVAFSARGLSASGDARVVVAGSIDGKNWTPPIMVDNPSQNPQTNPSGRGHQLMPAITFAQGRLTLLYYDLRLDHYVGFYSPNSSNPSGYTENLNPEGELALPTPMPGLVFTPFVDDAGLTLRRHTLDLRVLELGIFPTVTLGPSRLVSQYAYGCCVNQLLPDIEQYKFNVPNLPLFDQGQEPFFGDYIDVVPSPSFLPSGNSWKYNFTPSENPVFHATWTDNRDVVPPLNGDWTHYTPAVPNGTPSIFQPGSTVPDCRTGQEGMRNQNIYTSQIAGGLVVGAPGNAKPLGTTTNPLNGQVVPFQRGFAVVAQNITGQVIYVQLSIANQPTGGTASFLQFSPETTLQTTIPANSSISRTVFLTSTNPQASVTVNVRQITAIGGSVVTNGLSGSVVLNPDATNPQITNPNINNPNINNPNINNLEVTNPNINNPNINNPNINNPNINNPNINNPNINNPNINNQTVANASPATPNINNTTIANPDTANPNINNPNINNQNLSDGGTVTDVTYGITNQGNTTSAYTVKLTSTSTPPGGIVFQLIVNRLYQTPAAQNCQLVVETHWNTVANIINPKVFSPTDPNINNPDINNSTPDEATVTLQPGETGYITVRVMNPTPAATPFDPTTLVPATVPQAVNTATVLANPGNPNLTPPVVYPQLTVLTTALPPTDRNDTGYSVQLMAMGGKPGAQTWSIKTGALPPGINLSPSGLVSGTATTPGSYPVTIQVADTNSPAAVASQAYVFNVSVTPLSTQVVMPPPDGVVGRPYVATPLTVTGGTTPYTFTATGLPPGLVINGSTGQITGMPTVANPTGSPVMITATDAATPAEQVTYNTSIPVGAVIQISPAAGALTSGTIGVPYTYQLMATGGIGGLVFGTPGLPAGGTLDGTGLISFTSPQASNVSFSVTVHDQANPTQTVSSGTYTINFAGVAIPGSVVFVTQPTNTVVSQPITPAVQVEVLDSSASPVPGVTVTLILSTGLGTLSGTTSQVTNSAGIATFSNLSVNTAGTGDKLLATAGNATATSNPFNITTPAPQACAPTPGPLLSWWPFNGNALDIRGGKPGTLLGDFGTQSQFVSAEVGQGYKPNGAAAMITVPGAPYLVPVNFSVGAWIRVDSLSSDPAMQIVWIGDSAGDHKSTPYSLSVQGNGTFTTTGATVVGTPGAGKVVAIISDGVNELDVFSNTVLHPGVFYYVTLTWQGPSVGASIWINGALDQPSGQTPLIGLSTPTNPFQIGGILNGSPAAGTFNGVIDELQVFGNVLTQFQMQTIYNAGSAGQCQDLWFTEFNGGGLNNIGSITPGGSNSISQYTPLTEPVFPYNLAAGSDGNVWFTETDANKISVFVQLGGGAGFGEYAIPPSSGSSNPAGITSGPDTNLWFTQSVANSSGTNYVGSISTSGTINLYAVPSLSSNPAGITAGPDGNLWFAEKLKGNIARMTTAGAITEFSPTTPASGPAFITPGPDGNLWFTESSSNKIGVMTTTGTTVNEFAVPSNSSPFAIALGPDGNLWFTENGMINPGKIGRVTQTGTFTEFTIPTAGSGFPLFITAGPDGNVWYTDNNNGSIGRITPTGVVTEFRIGGLGTVTPTSGHLGSGYSVGDVLTVNQTGASGGTVRVTAISTSGAVSTVVVVSSGTGYSAATGLSVTGGSGSAALVDITGNVAPWGITLGPAFVQVPAPPTSVTGTNNTLSGVPVINWTASASSGVIGYNVYRSTSPNGPFILVGNPTSTNFTDPNAPGACGTGTTYYYFVTAVGTGNVESVPSNQTSVVAPSNGC